MDNRVVQSGEAAGGLIFTDKHWTEVSKFLVLSFLRSMQFPKDKEKIEDI